jgi:PAS domain S-box-containing protein
MKLDMDFSELLQKQVKKYLSDEYLKDQRINDFLSAINDSYNSFEKDKNINGEYELKKTETEKKLSHALKLLTTLLANLNSGILVVDENQRITFMNQHFCDALSIKARPEQMFGIEFSVTPDKANDMFKDPAAFISRIDAILLNKVPVFADELNLINGSILERDYIPIFIGNEHKGDLWTLRDITEQKQAQEALKVSEERYRNIVERSTDIIYKTNSSGFFTFINPVAERITGYKPKELVKKHFSLLIKEENRKDALVFYYEQVKQRKTTTYYEFPIITKSGEEVWIGQSVQLSELNKKDFELTALAIDITERKNYERTIFLQKEKYQNIIANMNLGLLEVDLKERIQFANPGFTAISGYTKEELIGKKASELFIADSHINLVKGKTLQRSIGVSDMYESPAKNKKGELRWWMISGAPNYDDKGNLIGSIGIHLDITEQKKLELELELAKSKAEESSKAKEAFLANMSHEIRTPLNAIIGMIRELAKEKLSDKQYKYVTNTSIASHHLLSVLNNILDISKIEAGELQLDLHHFRLLDLLNDVKSIMLGKAEEKGLYLKIRSSVNKDNCFIGDSSRFRQVFLNLLGNAIKFTHSGGITIDYATEDLYEGYQSVYIAIIDTGVGIEGSYLKNIFNKFSQEDPSTSRKYGGSGLGMAITYELIQLMNGTIDIQSTKNAGTCIKIKFLLSVGDISQIEKDVSPAEYNTLENANVLLVEDNDFNRAVACNTLGYYHCRVTEATNGKGALEKLASGEKFDIILMDLQMPVMDGFETTKKIRNELKLTIPIIAVTANAFKSELEQCLQLGMNDYVIKPFEEDKLIASMNRWLTVVSEQVISTGKQIPELVQTRLYDLVKFFGTEINDKIYVQKMIFLFVEQTQLSINQMKEAYAVKDLKAVSKIAHRIKPSIDSLYINSIRNEIREIEKNSHEGMDSLNLGEQIAFVTSVLTKVNEQLKSEII